MHRHFQTIGCQRTAEHKTLSVLTDIYKAANARESGAKSGDIDIAQTVNLGSTQGGKIKPAAVIKIKLRRLIDNGLGMHRSPKAQPTCRHPANRSAFDGERD